MEETLGKRISTNRKRLGITQDRLAEQLGVTAQAVSKWENDQSCPDITMLPKLADIFGISVDTLLGVTPPEPEKVIQAEVITDEQDGTETPGQNWELRWDSGRKGHIVFAIWVLLMGGLMLFNLLTDRQVSLWDMAWPSALLLLGLSRLYPRFSFFGLGCALFGGYSLLENMEFSLPGLSSQLLWPIAVILFGLSLLVDAVRKPHKPQFTIVNNRKVARKKASSCTIGEDSFDCSAAFCEDRKLINLPLMRRGNIDVSFGELTVDLTGCQVFAGICHVNADCAFGDLTILIPTCVRAEVDSDATFGSVDIRGECDQNTSSIVHINADTSFGQITIRYV